MSVTDDGPLSNQLALNILDHLPTPVMAVDRELQLIFTNSAGLKLLGKSWEEIENRPCHEIFNTRHCGTSDCRMRQVIDGGDAYTVRNEISINGRVLPMEYTAAALKDNEGNIVGGWSIFSTSRKGSDRRKNSKNRAVPSWKFQHRPLNCGIESLFSLWLGLLIPTGPSR